MDKGKSITNGPGAPAGAGASGDQKTKTDELPPIGSLSEDCNALKVKYDECFNSWFSEKFLRGDKNPSVCDEFYQAYNRCLVSAMEKLKIDVKEVNKELLEQTKNAKSKTSLS